MTKIKPFTVIHIIPTGIGCSIGGYAGDASGINALLSSCVDILITNPNVVNAAMLHNIPENVLYTEGYSLDSFCKGSIALRPVKSNKIGIIFDKAIPEDSLNVSINTIEACKLTYALDIIDYGITKENLNVSYSTDDDGFSSGSIGNIASLIDCCAEIIDRGATALAIATFIDITDENDSYKDGIGLDPIGGVEALISHLVSYKFNMPSAHAPVFSYGNTLPSKTLVEPKAAAEYISSSFLPCILYGLNKAPQPILKDQSKIYDLDFSIVDAVVTPINCLGSVPVIAALENNMPVITVENNISLLNVSDKCLNIENKIVKLKNYLEVAGFLTALRNGLNPNIAI